MPFPFPQTKSSPLSPNKMILPYPQKISPPLSKRLLIPYSQAKKLNRLEDIGVPLICLVYFFCLSALKYFWQSPYIVSFTFHCAVLCCFHFVLCCFMLFSCCFMLFCAVVMNIICLLFESFRMHTTYCFLLVRLLSVRN